MEKTAKIASPAGLSKVSPTPNKIVVDELIKAGKNAKGVLGMVAHAALVASAEFSKDKALTNNDRVEAVFETYKSTLAKIGDNNINKHFRNCLWLLIAPDEQLEVSAPKGESKAVTMRAGDVINNSSKATIQKLALDARAANGVGRKVTPKVVAKPVTFFDLLAAALNDKDQLIKVKLTLAKAGYALTAISSMTTKERDALPAIIPAANKISDMAVALI